MTNGEVARQTVGPVRVNEVDVDAPWLWLAAGWRDLWRRPLLSLGYGLAFSLISFGIVILLASADWVSLSIAAAGGFMLMGPMLAVGLYELSRRYETGEPIDVRSVLFVAVKSPTQLAYLGIALMGVLLIWIRIAMLLFALFQGTSDFPPLGQFLTDLLTTDQGISLLVTGTLVGAAIAMVVFVISAVSVPLLLDRNVDVVTAIITSVKAFQLNTGAMLLWAALVAVLGALGLATLFTGLIVTFPLLGHTTWHAYRALVTPQS